MESAASGVVLFFQSNVKVAGETERIYSTEANNTIKSYASLGSNLRNSAGSLAYHPFLWADGSQGPVWRFAEIFAGTYENMGREVTMINICMGCLRSDLAVWESWPSSPAYQQYKHVRIAAANQLPL